MSSLYITEFSRMASQEGIGHFSESGQMGALPAVTTQKKTYTAAAVQSAAFSAATKFIRVVATDDACIRIGSDPTAVNTDTFLPAGVVEYFGVVAGNKLSVIPA